jgi:beta-lactamase regulating signal transducer with metallopeptidase domain
MKNTLLWNIMQCFLSHHLFLLTLLQLLVTANFVPSSPILVTLMLESMISSKASTLTTVTPRHITEDGILHSHRPENLKSYIALIGLDSVVET